MKKRNGFVSNSSSCCFILDLNRNGVKELVDKIVAQEPCGLGRSTAKAVGEDAVQFANEWNSESEDWSYCLGNWILEWSDKLGEENIVFLRESDEGMGGYLFCNEHEYDQDNAKFKPLYDQLEKLTEAELEYH